MLFLKLPKTTEARGQVQQENSFGLFSFQAPWRVYLYFTTGWCHLYFDCMWEAAGFRRCGSDSPHDPDEPRICNTLQGGSPSSHTNTQFSSILMLLWDGSVVFLQKNATVGLFSFLNGRKYIYSEKQKTKIKTKEEKTQPLQNQIRWHGNKPHRSRVLVWTWTWIIVCVELCMFSQGSNGFPRGSLVSSHCPIKHRRWWVGGIDDEWKNENETLVIR